MSKQPLICKLFFGAWIFLAMSLVHAQTPLWSFTPLTPTSITVLANGTATVSYRVTNQSIKQHTLVMLPISGVYQITTAGNCPNPFVLGWHQSCILNLSISGKTLNRNVNGGPVVCEHGNPNQCHQPSPMNSLHIIKTPVYTVGGTVTGLLGTLVLANNGNDSLTINANGSFTFPTALPAGSSYSVAVQSQPAAQTCIVSNGNGSITNTNVTNVNVACYNATALTSSISSGSNLALSVTGHTEYGVTGTPVSGVSRVITITNAGSYDAVGFNVTYSGLPSDTTHSGGTCDGLTTLASGTSCTIQINPGANATSSCSNGTAPSPGAIQVSAINTNTIVVNIVVLDYGCIYQDGYVFAFNDTTPNTTSVGGKVAAMFDQSVGIAWDSSSGCVTSPFNNCYIAHADSTTNGTNLSTPSPGGNTYLIYQTLTVTHSELATAYAAGLCTAPISGQSDWYLPAICEMGYGDDCGTSTSPRAQNMELSLVEFNNLNLLTGFYWSSTEYTPAPSTFAWYQLFGSGTPPQDTTNKNLAESVRCVRLLTP